MRTPAAGASGLARSGQGGGETGGEKCCHPRWLFPSQNDSDVAKRKREPPTFRVNSSFASLGGQPQAYSYVNPASLTFLYTKYVSLRLRRVGVVQYFKRAISRVSAFLSVKAVDWGFFFYTKKLRSYNPIAE